MLLGLQLHSVFGDPTVGNVTVAVSCLNSVQAWLCLPSTVQQLTAAGYDMELLQSKMAAAVEAAVVVQQAGAATAALGALHPAVAQLVQRLHALGEALSAFAISSACNNPACSNIKSASEAQLVKGSSRTVCAQCAGCRKARYCCEACQKQHWKLHKPVCKALAAAGAACGVL